MEKQEKKITYLIQFLYYQMTFWGLCTLVVPIASGFHTKLAVGNWLVLSVVPFVLFVCRQRLVKIWQFLPAHIVIFLLLCIILRGEKVMRVIYAAGSLVMIGLSIKRKVTEEKAAQEATGHMVAIMAGTFSLLVLNYMGYADKGIYIGGCLILVFCEYILYQFLVRYRNFIYFSKDSADHVAQNAIFKNGCLRTAAMMAVTALSMTAVFYMELWQKVFLFLRQLIVGLLRFLISLLPKGKPQMQEAETAVTEELGGAVEMAGAEEVWAGWEVIWTVVSIAIFLLVLFLLLRAVWALVKLFLAAFGRNRAQEERIQDGEIEEVHESLQTQPQEKKEKHSIWDSYLTPEGKVRRMYRMYISELTESRKGRKQKQRAEQAFCQDRLIESLTPSQACILREQLLPTGMTEERLQEFCDIYEFTRYSGEKTSPRAAARMKKCLEK